MIGKEQTANQDDQKRIQELEQLLAQIKGNIEKRNQNIAAYQEEQRKSEDIKRPFIERQQAIQSQLNEVQTRDKELTAENQVWTNKRKGYQGEIKKWEKELERQKGLQENYRSLAEAK